MGLITLPITYLPYIMIGIDLLVGGPSAAAHSIAGAIVGHFWWWTMWMTERGRAPMFERYGRAPEWLRSLIGRGGPMPGRRGGVEVVPPPGNPAGGPTVGA